MKRAKFLLALGALFLALTHPASAHTTLVSEVPAAESQIKELPSELILTFAEDLIQIGDSTSLNLTDENGDEYTTGDLSINGSQVSKKIDPKEVFGKFKVSYRVVAADGHVIKGEYSFTVEPSAIETLEAIEEIPKEIATESGSQVSIYFVISATAVVGGGLILFFIWKRQSK
jgi:methionine-rich copper-binding protein CopC